MGNVQVMSVICTAHIQSSGCPLDALQAKIGQKGFGNIQIRTLQPRKGEVCHLHYGL